LYFGKHRFTGVEHLEIVVGGARLIRLPGPTYHPTLLTPTARLDQPILIFEPGSVDDATTFKLVAAGRVYDVAARQTEDGAATIDLSTLFLPPGTHRLTAYRDGRLIADTEFHWLPFALLETDLGERMIGVNLAEATIRSASPDQQTIMLTIERDGQRIADQS